MGVFNKLKEVLFDVEDDDEIPVITKDKEDREEEPVREENPIKEVKMPKDDFLDEIKTRDEIEEIPKPKKESTFNFPLDFEEDVPPIRSRRDTFDDDFVSRPSREVKREEPKRRDEYEYDYSRLNIRDTRKEEKTNFKPSPIISPVYGILDQNYTKDDVIVKNDGSKRKPNLDDVRKKVYSKKKAQEEEKDEFEEPLKTLDEILIDKEEVKEEIPKTKKKQEIEEDVVLDETLPIGVYDDELPDEPYPDEEEETDVLEDVKEEKSKEDELESDLFNLIDSMYEDKNEREEEE